MSRLTYAPSTDACRSRPGRHLTAALLRRPGDRGHRPSPSASPSRYRPSQAPANKRCYTETKLTDDTIKSGESTMPVAIQGTGKNAAVMLHETGGSGLCGWLAYTTLVVGDEITTYSIDLCGYGSSSCVEPFASDPLAQVKAAVDFARAHGASSVTVVGGSMGGAVALGTTQQAGADAVVDLSGPASWSGVPGAVEAAKATTIPLFIACDPKDLEMKPDVLEQAVAASPSTTKRWLRAPSGHGITLTYSGLADPKLTTLGKDVARWIKGDYVGA